MPRILEEIVSSGTTNTNILLGSLFQEPDVLVGVWNTAEIGFDPSAPTDLIERSPRPLSALADLAVDLGPADLSTTFQGRR